MTELEVIFAELGLQQYLSDFVEQGFDSWETILDITESDFDALGVKLGHRRKVQRKIANSRGQSSDTALGSSTRNTPSDDKINEEQKGPGTRPDARESSSVTQGAKRKYRRHPKPDEHAPERPPSAYVIFSNSMREQLKGRNLSFTEIAKLVGENWQTLQPHEKDPYEQKAFAAKEKFNNELTEYKKTVQYKEYQVYLAEFKARQGHQQQADGEYKRPKLEPHVRTRSTATNGSDVGQHGGDIVVGRAQAESPATSTSQWITRELNSPPLTVSVPRTRTSPPSTSPPILPGYREAIFAENRQTPTWRDGFRDDQQLPGIGSVGTSQIGTSSDTLNSPASTSRSHRTLMVGNPPPLLTRQSTNRSTGSSNFSYGPRTPMEIPLETIPTSYYSQKIGNHENQLPPILAPSLSPRSAIVNAQHSPNGIHPMSEFPTSMAPLRGYGPVKSLHTSESKDVRLREFTSPEDITLDPVSALIRAGEVLNEKSRRTQTP